MLARAGWLITGRVRGELNSAGRRAVLCPRGLWGSQCVIKSCSATSGSSSASLNCVCCSGNAALKPRKQCRRDSPKVSCTSLLPGVWLLDCPGPCGRGDASGGVEQMVSPSQKCSCHSVNILWGLLKEQSLVLLVWVPGKVEGSAGIRWHLNSSHRVTGVGLAPLGCTGG